MRTKRVLISLLVVVVVVFAGGFLTMHWQEGRMARQDFTAVNLDTLPDGIYHGSVSAVLVHAKAAVEIKDGRITNLQLLEHRHGPGYGAVALCDAMVRENRVDVDSISGATFSSLVVKSAVLSALKGGKAQ